MAFLKASVFQATPAGHQEGDSVTDGTCTSPPREGVKMSSFSQKNGGPHIVGGELTPWEGTSGPEERKVWSALDTNLVHLLRFPRPPPSLSLSVGTSSRPNCPFTSGLA